MKKICFYALLLFTFSCDRSENDDLNNDLSQSNNFAVSSKSSVEEESRIKRDLFRSIFFLDGTYASKIDLYAPTLEMIELQEKEKPSFSTERRQFSDAVYDIVYKERPELIDNLYSSIDSQDINRIDEAMEATTHFLTTKLTYYSTEEGRLEAPACLVGPAVVAVAAWEVAIAVNVAVAASVAAAVTVYVWKYTKFWPKKASVSELLENEAFEKQVYLVSLSNLLHE